MCLSAIFVFHLLQVIYFVIIHKTTGDEAWVMVGRSLKVIKLDDYGGPTANRGHDPTWKKLLIGGGHPAAGRKG
jgi:hypothetical protein